MTHGHPQAGGQHRTLELRERPHADHFWKREKADDGVRGAHREVLVRAVELDAVDVGGVRVDGLQALELVGEHFDGAQLRGHEEVLAAVVPRELVDLVVELLDACGLAVRALRAGVVLNPVGHPQSVSGWVAGPSPTKLPRPIPPAYHNANRPGMHWEGVPPPQPMPSHSLPDGKCQAQWHL